VSKTGGGAGTRKAGAAARLGWGARLVVMLFSGVFMLGFGAGGLFFGLIPILDNLRMAWVVRDWQPVSAQVIDVGIEERRGSKGSRMYVLNARYAYRYGGRDYESTRVGLDHWGGADNVGTWHEDWHHRLSDARSREQPVAAWVDPQRPQRAVLERRLRWGMLAFRLPFAIFFTAVGVGAAFVFFRALLGRATMRPRLSSARPSSASPPRQAAAGAAGAAASETQGPAVWPRSVTGRLDGGGVLRFRRTWLLLLGMLAGVLALMGLLAALADDAGGARWLTALAVTLGLLLAVHGLSSRWTWQVRQGSLHVSRGSWLLRREWQLSRAEVQRLADRLVYTQSTSGGPTVEHRALYVATTDGRRLDLSPALPAPQGLRAVSEHLRAAMGTAAPRDLT